MAISILVSEDDLRRMPLELRDALLKWYFDTRPGLTADGPRLTHENGTSPEPIIRGGIDSLGESSERVTFPELVREGFIRVGDQVCCKALKRQQRKGLEALIEGAAVATDGRVEFQGQRFAVPTKLAMAMVNTNGGKAKALNGYDYLFVRTAKGLISLEQIRRMRVSHPDGAAD